MEKYSNFNQKLLSSLGISSNQDIRKFAKPLKIFTAIVIVVSTFQSLMFLITVETFDFLVASAFTIGLYDLQGCFKFFTVIMNIDKLSKIKATVDELMTKITKEQLVANFAELERFRKVTKSIVMTNITCAWTFNILPMATVAYFFFAKGFFIKIMPYAFWYPFNKTEHYFPVYFYEISCAHTLVLVPLVMDGLVLLMLGQLLVLFKCLGEDLVTMIDEYDPLKSSETVSKINQAINTHNVLLDLSAELLTIYEIPLLVNVMSQTGTICFIAFIISVRINGLWICVIIVYSQTQGIDLVVPSLYGLFNSLAQIFMLCWFGEKLKDAVSQRYRKTHYVERF